VLWELSVIEQRYNAVMEVLRDGHTVVEVADRYGVSRQAVHRWLRRYAQGGLDALGDRSHRPRSCPHQLPEAVEALIYQLRRAHPGWGPRRLGHELARQGVTPVPSRATIYRRCAGVGWSSRTPVGARKPPGGAGSANDRCSCGRWTSWAASS
jgi:transposase